MTAPIVITNVQFEDSFKVHNPLHKKINEKYGCDNILCGMLFVMFGDFGGF